MKIPELNFANLRMSAKDIGPYSDRYTYAVDENVSRLVSKVQNRGYLAKEELTIVGQWKSPRIRLRLAKNMDEAVVETTRHMLATRNIRLAVHIPKSLEGVGMPVASTLLHWFHTDPFPILDYRALWSLGIEGSPEYTLEFWEFYVRFVRALRSSWGVDMRTLDRALWQFSKENQPKRGE